MITEAVHCDEPVDKVRKLIRKHQAVLVVTYQVEREITL